MGKLLVAVALAVVACVLLAGIVTLWIGGDVSKTWSNRLMRIRVLAQFIAIIVIVLVFWLTSRH